MQNIHVKIAQYIIQKYEKTPTIIVLTPNQRLTNYLYNIINQYNQIELQKVFWERPLILPFSSWLSLLWENIPNTTCLLNHVQEYDLWAKIIYDSSLDHHSLYLATAKSNQIIHNAIKAWNLLHNWQIPLEQIKQYAFTDEIKYFYSWANKYKEYLSKQNSCTLSQVPQLLANILKNDPEILGPLSNNLLFVDFDYFSLTPQEKNLRNILAKNKCCIEDFDTNQQISQQQQIAAPNNEDELYAMASWAHAIHQHEPNATIGCVVPKLQFCHDKVKRIFTEIFAQNLGEAIYKHELPPTINISLGKTLDQYPLVDCALTILSLGQDNLTQENWQKLLTTPFINDNWLNNISTSLAWEKIKTTTTSFSYSNAFSFNQLSQILKVFCRELFANIENYYKTLATLTSPQTTKNWIHFFNTQLQNFGWPGTRNLTSQELQTLEKWQKLCHEFSSLDLIYPNGLSYTAALAKLSALTQNTIFQPSPSKDELAKINILGTLEAAGLNFDYLWVMSMDDQNWPPPPSPNPFIPLELQRTLNMPNASTVRELEFCRTIMQRQNRSAQKIIYSYSQQNNERTNRISHLLKHLPKITVQDLYKNTLYSTKTDFQGTTQIDSSSLDFPRGMREASKRNVLDVHEHCEQTRNKAVQNCLEQFCPCSKIEHDPKDVKQDSVAQNQNAKSISPQKTFITIRNLLKNKLEKYTDTTAPMVKPPETIKGGTSILQSQISCPFQAFATYRLKATKTNKFSQKILRGNVVHKALEEIWKTLKDSEDLNSYCNNQTQLEKLINSAINHAFSFAKQQNNNQSLPNNFLNLEKSNLQNLLQQWLKMERDRDFFTVIQTEKEIEMQLSNLTLRLRIDRIDQLVDGKIAIIDYKTGKDVPSLNDCLNIPPTATQLPLYSLAANILMGNRLSGYGTNSEQIAALIFAHINRENFNTTHKPFVGICNQKVLNLLQNKNISRWLSIDMENTMAQWQASLTKIADDFMHGVVFINPRKPEICKLCNLQSLCRIKN